MLNATVQPARSPERWAWKPGYEGLYKVSSRGEVLSMPRNTTKGGLLRQTRRRDRYRAVVLTKDGAQRTFLVHVLVAEAFLGPRPPGDIQVLHKDGIKDHNDVSNLRYGTRAENGRDTVRHGNDPHRRKSRCPSGHLYDEENTRWYRGYRICITCVRQQKADYNAGIRKSRPLAIESAAPVAVKKQFVADALPIDPGTGEVWIPVPRFEVNYEVSDFGRIRSLPHRTAKGWRGGRILKGTPRGKMRYLVVSLSVDGASHIRYVHQLVVEAFIGPRPEGLLVRHLDGDVSNNRISNLTYGTVAENARDTVRHGRNKNASRTHCGKNHLFTEENTIVRSWPDGRFKQRVCRICLEGWKATTKARRQERAA